MNVLTLYIIREIIKASLIALLLLLTLFNLFTFSDELSDLGTGNYGLKEIFEFLLLTSPRTIYELVPSSVLIGSLFVVGSMANNREIIAMRAAGVSVLWIVRTIMLAGVVLVVFSMAFGEFVAPKTERMAQELREEAQKGKVVMRSQYGMWFREGQQFINVRQIQSDDVLKDVFIYQLNDRHRLELMMHIQKAVFQGKGTWKLEQVEYSEVSGESVLAGSKAKEEWHTSIDPGLLDIVVVREDELPLYDLYQYIHFLQQNNQKSDVFELAFWSRLFNPLATFAMLMIAVPFVVGVHRNVSTGGRLMAGIVIGMIFNILDKMTGHLGLVYGFNPAVMAILPSLIMLGLAFYAIRRVG